MSALRGQRWLVVVEEPFLPADTGGRVEHRGFLRAAAAAGITLDILVPSDAPVDAAEIVADLVAGVEDPAPITVTRAPRKRSKADLLGLKPYVVASRPLPAGAVDAARAQGHDAVVSYSARVAHLGEQLAAGLSVPHLVRAHNRDSDYFRQLARGASLPRRVGYLLEARRMAAFEKSLHQSTSISAFADLSAEDAAWRRGLTRHPVLHVPPFLPAAGASVTSADRAPAEAATVLFTGSLDVESNITAVTWLVQDVWPRVLQAVPGAQLQVVGRRPGAALSALISAAPSTTLHADVPSLTPFLSSAWVSVNPTLEGSGVNIKLIEAMAAGLPTVSTLVGGRGLDWVPGRDLLIASEAGAFAGEVVRLLGDPGLRAEIGAAASAYVRQRLDPAVLLGEIATGLR